jgi:hypothetical protein
MRNLLVLFYLFLSINSFGQEEKGKERIIRFGGGPAIEGNWGYWAFNLVNEFSLYTGERFSINPSITYFFSVAEFGGKSINRPREIQANIDNEHMASIFSDLRFQYDLINTPNGFRVGFAFGPSFQLGGEAMHRGYLTNEFGEFESIWAIDRFSRLGYVTQITFDWKGKGKIENRIGLSMSSFDGYWPYYLMVNYRIGLHL